jgi:hypothetical protein
VGAWGWGQERKLHIRVFRTRQRVTHSLTPVLYGDRERRTEGGGGQIRREITPTPTEDAPLPYRTHTHTPLRTAVLQQAVKKKNLRRLVSWGTNPVAR